MFIILYGLLIVVMVFCFFPIMYNDEHARILVFILVIGYILSCLTFMLAWIKNPGYLVKDIKK